MIQDQEALEYHERGRLGKLEVVPSKPCITQRDLSLAYTPGVAVPCRRIQESPEDAYRYTGKGNLVAVVSNGTAVLGLGDIGALAGKPVMEGKGVLLWEAAAVAEAAMATGVARRPVDLEAYRVELESHLGKARHLMRLVINQAKRVPKRVVFPEGTEEKVLRAAHVIADEGFALPILLGNRDEILRRVAELGIDLDGVTLVEPGDPETRERYAEALFRMRHRKGMTLADARTALRDPAMWGAMMVELGDADGLVGGVGQHFPDAIRPALRVIGKRADVARVAGLFLMQVGDEVYLQRGCETKDVVYMAAMAVLDAQELEASALVAGPGREPATPVPA